MTLSAFCVGRILIPTANSTLINMKIKLYKLNSEHANTVAKAYAAQSF